MALFEWHATYSVGIDEADKQHKMLVDTLNEVYEAMRDRATEDVIDGILKGLTDYVGVHFSFEEQLMKKHGFPGYDQHKQQHEDFKAKVGDFLKKREEGKLMLSMEVMNFLKDWLKSHIMDSDKKYGEFFKEKGVI